MRRVLLLIPLLLTVSPVQASWKLEASEQYDRSFPLRCGWWAVTGALYNYSYYHGPLPHGGCEVRKDVLLVRCGWQGNELVYEVDRLAIGLKWNYSASPFGPIPPGGPVPEPFEEPGEHYSGRVSVVRGELEPVGALWVRKFPDEPSSYRPVPVLAVRAQDGVHLLVLDERSRVLDLGPVKGKVLLTHSLLEVRQIGPAEPEVTVPPARVLFVDGDGNLIELDPTEGTRRTLAHLPDSARVWGWVSGGYLVTTPEKTLLISSEGEVREVTLPEGWRIFALPENDYYRKYGLLLLASDEGLAVGRLEGSEIRILTPALDVPADARFAWLTPWHWDGVMIWKHEDTEGTPGGVLLALWHGSELILAAWHRGSSWEVQRVILPGDVGTVVGVAIGANERWDARSVSLVFVPGEGELSVHRVTASVVPYLTVGDLLKPFLPVLFTTALMVSVCAVPVYPIPPIRVRPRRGNRPDATTGGTDVNSGRRSPSAAPSEDPRGG